MENFIINLNELCAVLSLPSGNILQGQLGKQARCVSDVTNPRHFMAKY